MDRDLRIRVILSKLGDLVGPLKAIGNQAKATTDGLRATQDRLKALQSTQSNIASFRALKGQLQGTSTAMTQNQALVDDLATAMAAVPEPTKKMSAEFKRATAFAAALKTQHAEQSAALQDLRDKLSGAGISTRDLVAGERTLRGHLAQTTEQLDAQRQALANLAAADRRRAANQDQLDRTRNRAANIAVGGAATLGAGLAILRPLKQAVGVASQYQSIMTSIGQKTGLSRIEATRLGLALASIGPRVNQLPADLAAGADALAGLGLAAKNIPTLLLPIGRAATAYEAQIEDLSRASFALVDNLKVPFDQSARAIDIMAEAGKRGAFELKDMAQFFPALTASAQGLGQTGAPAVADLAAALQIARKGAGDASSAAGNLQNLLAKISSPATSKAFAKMGVDLPAALKKMYAQGKTPIEAISELTNKTLNGDLSKLGNLFEDMQVQQALRPLIGNLALYRQIRSDALKATGTVEADYAQRLLDAGQATKALEVVTQSLQVKLGTVLLPTMVKLVQVVSTVLDRVIAWADANPRLAQVLAITAGALGALLVVVGGLAIAIGGILGPFAALRFAMAALVPAGWGILPVIISAVATAFMHLYSVGLLFVAANPFAAIVLGIGLAVLAIHNHWASIVAGFNWGLQQLGALWSAFKAVGGHIWDGFWEGLHNAYQRFMAKFAALPDKIAGLFRNKLGIRSPSRVFASYGHNLMAGLANGIAGNTNAPLARISNASRAITAALAIGAATAGPAAATGTGSGAGAGTGGAASTSAGTTHNWYITQLPGESSDALAKRIAAEFDKRDRAKAAALRSSFGDYGE